MTVTVNGENPDVLLQWRDADSPTMRHPGRRLVDPTEALRFAFYGRLSTKEHQHFDTSRGWQPECAKTSIGGFGTIVAAFFDAGFSRRRSWPNRPQAAALLAVVTSDACPFDAVAVDEYERAFCGRQVFPIAGLLGQHDLPPLGIVLEPRLSRIRQSVRDQDPVHLAQPEVWDLPAHFCVDGGPAQPGIGGRDISDGMPGLVVAGLLCRQPLVVDGDDGGWRMAFGFVLDHEGSLG